MPSEGESDDHAALRAIWQQHRAKTLERVAALGRATRSPGTAGSATQSAKTPGAKRTLAGTVAFFGFRDASRIASEVQRFFLPGSGS